jgi:DNA-binding NarL/FixJ family response regulator
MSNWIGIVEAGYDLASTPSQWLERLLDQAAPLMDRGVGVNAQIFRVSPTQFSLEELAVRGIGTPEQLRAFLENAPPEAIDLVYRQGAPVGSLSEWLFPATPVANREFVNGMERHFVLNTPDNFQDSLGLTAHTGTGWGVVVTAPLPRPERMGDQERKNWTRIAAHLGAGLRLRQKFASLNLNSERVEAIMTPDGKVQHAREASKPASARERLRDAVRDSDRARMKKQRNDPDGALDLWEGLVRGRWSLVDHFDSDQRRFVVAIKNDPEVSDPRGLTLRERQVAEFCGMNRSAKEIAYILGLSNSAIGNALTRASQKLGLNSRTELAALFSPKGMRARMAELELAGEQIAIGSYPIADEKRFANLTDAERSVAIHLMQGATYSAIAEQRSAAERTIANQAQSIYRKLKVRSRVELAAALGTTRS